MKRHAENRPFGPDVVYTAVEEFCPDCHRPLPIYQVDSRRVQGLEEVFWLKRREKRCRDDCPGSRPIFTALRDLRVVLPGRIYGLDVTLCVGERHLREGVSLAQITRDLNAQGLPIDQRHTGRVFRDFMALTTLAKGDDEELKAGLRAQGGIVLMFDGVQFDERSPVLYLAWDAISGQPLFGERKTLRSQRDLVPVLERVRDMDVPIIGVVTDKERALVPAVEEVFPGTPYQFCQTHFLKNCARPLQEDTSALGASVRRRAEEVRKLSKRLSSSTSKVEQESTSAQSAKTSARPESKGTPDETPPSLNESELVQEVGELVKVNSRVSGKAPLDPPELGRHERLEKIRGFVDGVKKKATRPKKRSVPCLKS